MITQELYNVITKWIKRDIDPLARSLNRALSDVKKLVGQIDSLTTKQEAKYAPPVKKLTPAQKLIADAYNDYKETLTRQCEDTFAKAIGSRQFLASHKTEIKLQVMRQLQSDFEELVRSSEERVKFQPPVKAKRVSEVTPPRTAPSGNLTAHDAMNRESQEIYHVQDRRTTLVHLKHLQELNLKDYQEERETVELPQKEGFQDEPCTLSLESGLIDSLPVDDGIQIKDPNMAHDYDYIIPEENWDGNA